MDQLPPTEREKLAQLGQRAFILFRILDKHFPGQYRALAFLLMLKDAGIDIGPLDTSLSSTKDKQVESACAAALLEKLEQIAPEVKATYENLSDAEMNVFHGKALSFVHYMDMLDEEQLGDRARRFLDAAGIMPRPTRVGDLCAELWVDWKAEPFIKTVQYLFALSVFAGIAITIFQLFYMMFFL